MEEVTVHGVAESVLQTGTSQVAQLVKNPPASTGVAGDLGSVAGSGRSLEGEMATHSIPTWGIPWTEECGGLFWGYKESDMTAHSTASSSSVINISNATVEKFFV